MVRCWLKIVCVFLFRAVVWFGGFLRRVLPHDTTNQDEPSSFGERGRGSRRTGQRMVRPFNKKKHFRKFFSSDDMLRSHISCYICYSNPFCWLFHHFLLIPILSLNAYSWGFTKYMVSLEIVAQGCQFVWMVFLKKSWLMNPRFT